MIDRVVREAVRQRAKHCCEYCGIHQSEEPFTRFQVEHVIARQHGGTDGSENLALACPYCNLHKGPNIAGIDPAEGVLTRLFNPRLDHWDDHFQLVDSTIHGRTSIGRATVRVLAMNDPIRIELRTEIENSG